MSDKKMSLLDELDDFFACGSYINPEDRKIIRRMIKQTKKRILERIDERICKSNIEVTNGLSQAKLIIEEKI